MDEERWSLIRFKHEWRAAEARAQARPWPAPTSWKRAERAPYRLPWILLAVALGGAAAFLVARFLYQPCPHGPGSWICQLHRASIENPPWVLLSSVAAAPSLMITWWWRTTHKDAYNVLALRHERAVHFFQAVKLLTSRRVEVRTAAVLALASLAEDSERDYARVVDTLCAFLREHARSDEVSPEVTKALLIIGSIAKPEDRALSSWRTEDTSLRHAQLQGAKMEGANFNEAQLQEAAFTRSDCSAAYFEGANLSGAKFENVQLRGARTCDSWRTWKVQPHGLQTVDLRGAIYDAATLLPDDFDPQAAGMTPVPEGRTRPLASTTPIRRSGEG